NKENVNKEHEEYSLYTEKIIPSRRVKYRKIISFAKFVLFIIVSMVVLVVTDIYIVPVAEKYLFVKKESEDVIEFQKDEYELADEGGETRDDGFITAEDLKKDYDTVMNMLRQKVDGAQKCIVTVEDREIGTDYEAYLENQNNNLSTSGLIVGHINSRYLILTSKKFTDKSPKLVVKFSGEEEIMASFVCSDKDTGISIISINDGGIDEEVKKSLDIAMMDNSYKLQKGDLVIAAGKMYGTNRAVDYGTVTNITSINGLDNSYELIDTNLNKMEDDFAFLFNSLGNVVGITAESDATETTLKALGISDLKSIIEKMINQQVTMYFGIRGQNVTSELSDKYGLPTGIYISEIERDSPAYQAGLQPGDVITAVDHGTILTIQSFSEKLYRCVDGQTMNVSVKRQGKEGYINVSFDVIVRIRMD
ncbi:MAG: S1C family serine protease, partial [Eubacteriales bacterium]|nr:S1C family serine protease [Eubacteriales bacterium]